MAHTAISKIEQGQRSVTLGEAYAIAVALDISLEQLVTGEPVPMTVYV